MTFLRKMAMMIMAISQFISAKASEDGVRKSIQIPEIGLFGVRLCQNQTESLACPENRVIQFVDVFYSKSAANSQAETCADDRSCRRKSTDDVMHKQYGVCARQRKCDVGVRREWVSCPGGTLRVATYMEIIYTCVEIGDFQVTLPADRTNNRKINYDLSAEEWVRTTLKESEKLQKLVNDSIQEYSASLTAELNRKIGYIKLTQAYLKTRIADVDKKASRMCQTGNVSCEGNCGGRDIDAHTHTLVEYVAHALFHPKFKSMPTVTLATNMLWTNSLGENDHWGFKEEVKEVSLDGFTAYLWAWDSPITWHGATWIACGEA